MKETLNILEMLEEDGDVKATRKIDQLYLLDLVGLWETDYPPRYQTVEQQHQFDDCVIAAAKSASKEIGLPIQVVKIRRIICAYACRTFALKEVVPAANELSNKLLAFIKTYENKNTRSRGVLEERTGAAEPLAEALRRLTDIAYPADSRLSTTLTLFIADMAALYKELTGKQAGKTSNEGGSPFARFSFEAAMLAQFASGNGEHSMKGTAGQVKSGDVEQWAEVIKKHIPLILAKEFDNLEPHHKKLVSDPMTEASIVEQSPHYPEYVYPTDED